MTALARRDVLKLPGAALVGGVATSGVAATRRAQQSATWPQYQYDAANTGVTTETQGPHGGIELNWKNENVTNDDSGITTAPTLVDGTLFFGSWDNHLYAVDAETGAVNWKRDLGWSIRSRGTAVDDGNVVVGTGEGKVYALTTEQGRVEWSVNISGNDDIPIIGSPTIADGTVYVSNAQGTLLALTLADGTEDWRFETTGLQSIIGAPAVDGETVYIGVSVPNEMPSDTGSDNPSPFNAGDKEEIEDVDTEGRVLAIDTTDGTEQWEASTGHGITASPVVADDTVFVGSWDRVMYAFASEDGSKQWQRRLPDVIVPAPTIVENRLYVGTHDGTVHALQTQDGSIVWQRDTQGSILSPFLSDGDRLYVSDDKRILSLGLESGTERWRFNTNGWDVWTPALGNGTLYFGGGRGRMFGLTAGSSIQLEVAGPDSGSRDVFSKDRGLITNGGDAPDFITNVFNLTIIGFFLSVIGIVHQMLEGR